MPDIGAYEAGTLSPNYNAYIYETLPAAATPAHHAVAFDFDGDGDGDGQTNEAEWRAITNAPSSNSFFALTATVSVKPFTVPASTPGRRFFRVVTK